MKQVLLVATAAAVLVFPALGASAGHHPKNVGPLGPVPVNADGRHVGHLGVRNVGGKQAPLGAAANLPTGPTNRDNLTYGK